MGILDSILKGAEVWQCGKAVECAHSKFTLSTKCVVYVDEWIQCCFCQGTLVLEVLLPFSPTCWQAPVPNSFLRWVLSGNWSPRELSRAWANIQKCSLFQMSGQWTGIYMPQHAWVIRHRKEVPEKEDLLQNQRNNQHCANLCNIKVALTVLMVLLFVRENK